MALDQRSSSSLQSGPLQPSKSGGPQSSARIVAAERGSSLAHGPLVPCVYIAMRCSRCGNIRQALAALPKTESTVCPECAQGCSFVFLGPGLTKRVLPFYELYPVEPTSWDRHGEETDDDS